MLRLKRKHVAPEHINSLLKKKDACRMQYLRVLSTISPGSGSLNKITDTSRRFLTCSPTFTSTLFVILKMILAKTLYRKSSF